MDNYDRLPQRRLEAGTNQGTRSHVAFVDDVLYAKEFRTGDCVRKTGLRDFVLTPYAGRVLYSNPATGVVMVQWPWGAETQYATELVHDLSDDFKPPSFDQSYSTYESYRNDGSPKVTKSQEVFRKSVASTLVDEFKTMTRPVYAAACKAWHAGVPESDAKSLLTIRYASDFGSDVVNSTISDLYDHGRRIAIYWVNSNRQYRMTKSEKDSGRYSCPRCAGTLKPRTYRHATRMMQCRTCGFSIHNDDLV